MDDFYDPLGLGPGSGPPKRRIPFRLIFIAAVGVAIVASFILPRLSASQSGGEPQAVAAILPEKTIAPAGPQKPADTAPTQTGIQRSGPARSMVEDAADVEQKSGVKVVRSGGGAAPGAAIIEVPQGLNVTLAPAPDPRLAEPSRYGLLPRVGADGARPADVYARPVVAPPAKANAPRIALVIGGLGLSQTVTDVALADLPGAVTLAFAPYGKNLATNVAAARAQGHEIILQLPMEPIDYPQTYPGPHTLLSSASQAENTDDLHWLMSRFTGYTGVANFLGAKLTANSAALAPILSDIAKRGLFYIDDGSSPQSLALTLAANSSLAAAKVDVILDATPDGIDAALVKLEAVARDKGFAIGMASALPASLERIGAFARSAEANGLILIPLSAAIGKTTPALVTNNP